MLVNSLFTGFFDNRLVLRTSIASAMFAVFFITSSFSEHFNQQLKEKQVNLIVRQIGHRLLQQAGDSTSRVLPVTENKEGTVVLRFEKELVFNHDSLMVLTRGLLPKSKFPSGYTVTVHDCRDGAIVYGFQVSNTSPDILACNGRSQPAGCYTIEFAFPDLYQTAKQTKGEAGQSTGAGNVGTMEVNSKIEESKTNPVNNHPDQQIQTPEPIKIAPRQVGSTTDKVKTTIFNYELINVVSGGLLVLLAVGLLTSRFRKNVKPVPGQQQQQVVIEDSHAELPAIGKFLFNVKSQRLLLGTEVISLTDKERQVLELLHKNFGELIPRETLLQEVWINEGVITGRSLDMFVSKLRKKLSGDPELKITNVHGKGYKLEIPEREIG